MCGRLALQSHGPKRLSEIHTALIEVIVSQVGNSSIWTARNKTSFACCLIIIKCPPRDLTGFK